MRAEAEGHLAEVLTIAKATVPTCGKGPNTKVYLSTEDTALLLQGPLVPTACKSWVYCKSAVAENAENFVIGKRKPCDSDTICIVFDDIFLAN